MKFTKDWFINISIGQPTVRNQGIGIAKGVRYAISQNFEFADFFKALDSKDPNEYTTYLDNLANSLMECYGLDKDNKPTKSKIPWGVGRKCVNILARNIIYNRFIWDQIGYDPDKFDKESHISKLELPLDSFTINGLKDDCKTYNIPIIEDLAQPFTIKYLLLPKSKTIQGLASLVAEARGTHRVHLDILYWREKKENGDK